MCEKLGILRLVICYLTCFCLLVLSFFSVLSDKSVDISQNEEISYFWSDSVFTSSKENITQTEQKPQETAKEQNINT